MNEWGVQKEKKQSEVSRLFGVEVAASAVTQWGRSSTARRICQLAHVISVWMGEIEFLETRFIFVEKGFEDLCLCEVVRVLSENLAGGHASSRLSQPASSSSVCCLSPPSTRD